jgi:hypothetical protein
MRYIVVTYASISAAPHSRIILSSNVMEEKKNLNVLTIAYINIISVSRYSYFVKVSVPWLKVVIGLNRDVLNVLEYSHILNFSTTLLCFSVTLD